MKVFRAIFFPTFLRKLDRKLEINYPALWLSNVHYSGYYLLLATIFTLIVGATYPLNEETIPREDNLLFVWAGVFLIPLVLWARQQVLRSSEPTFRLRTQVQGQFILLMHTLVISSMLFQPELLLKLVASRVDSQFSYKELIEDTNALNAAAPFLSEGSSKEVLDISNVSYHDLSYFTSKHLRGIELPYSVLSNDELLKQLSGNYESATYAVPRIEAALNLMQKYGVHEAASIDPKSLFEKFEKGKEMGIRSAKRITRRQLHNIAYFKSLNHKGVFHYELMASVFIIAFLFSVVLYVFMQMKFSHFIFVTTIIFGFVLLTGFLVGLSGIGLHPLWIEKSMLLFPAGLYVTLGLYALKIRNATAFKRAYLIALSLFTIATPLIGLWLMKFCREMNIEVFPFYTYEPWSDISMVTGSTGHPDLALLFSITLFFFAFFPFIDRLFLRLNSLPKKN